MTPCTRWGHAQRVGARRRRARHGGADRVARFARLLLIFPALFGALLYPAPRSVLDFLGGV